MRIIDKEKNYPKILNEGLSTEKKEMFKSTFWP